MLKLTDLKLHGNMKLNLTAMPTIWWIAPTKTMGPYGSDFKPSKVVDVTLKAGTNTGHAISYSVNNGLIPAGVTLAQDGHLSGDITGPDGIYAFTVKAESGSVSLLKNLKMVVGNVPPPIWDTQPGILDTMAYTGGAFSYQLLAHDELDLPIFFTLVGGSLPAGLTIDANTGQIIGTPSLSIMSDGIYNILVSVSNLSAAATRAFQIYVSVIPPDYAPVWVTPSGQIGDDVIETQEYDFHELEANDPNNLPITYLIVAGSLPDGILIDGPTGIVAGTAPGVPDDTTYTFIAGARTDLYTTPRLFKIKVKYVVPPDFGNNGGSIDLGQWMENEAIPDMPVQVISTSPLLPLTYSSTGLEDFPELTFNANGVLTGVMSPYPPLDGHDVFAISFTVTATNGIKSADVEVSIKDEKNLPPHWNASNNILMADLAGSVLVDMPDPLATDPNGRPILYTLQSSLPESISFDLTNGVFSGTLPPVENQDETFTIDVTANDGVHAISQSFVFASWFNTPPIFDTPEGNIKSVVAGFGFSATVVAYDPQEKAITYTLQTALPNVAINPVSGAGVISGVAPDMQTSADFEYYDLIVTASDGVLSNTQTYQLTVERDQMPVWITNAGSLGSALGGSSFRVDWTAIANNTGQDIVYYISNTGNLPPMGESAGESGEAFMLTPESFGGRMPNRAPNTPPYKETYWFEIGVYDKDGSGEEVPNHRVLRVFTFDNLYNNTPVWVSTLDTSAGQDMSASDITHDPDSTALPPVWTQYTLSTFNNHWAIGENVAVIMAASNTISYTLDTPSFLDTGLSFYGHQDLYLSTFADPTESPLYDDLMALDGANVAIIAGRVADKIADPSFYGVPFTANFTAQNQKADTSITLTYTMDQAYVLADVFETMPILYQFDANSIVYPYDPDGQTLKYFYSDSTSTIIDGDDYHVAIDQENGIVSGAMPPVAQDSMWNFGVSAWDQTAGIDNGFYYKTPHAFRIISRYNRPPVWSSGNNTFGLVQNKLFQTTLSASGKGNAQGMVYTVVGGELPPLMTLSSGGLLRGMTQTVDADTTYNFTVQADNGIKTSTKNFSFKIYKNEPPVWTTISADDGYIIDTHGNATVSATLTATDPNIDNGSVLSFTLNDRGNLPDEVYMNDTKSYAQLYYSHFDYNLKDTLGKTALTPSRSLTNSDFVPGKFGNAVHMDGSYTLSGYYGLDSRNDFQFDAWVKMEDDNGLQVIMATGNATLSFHDHCLFLNVTNTVVQQSRPLNLDQWYHVSMNKKTSQFSLAVDGEYVSTAYATDQVTGLGNAVYAPVSLGSLFSLGSNLVGANPFHGDITEVRLSNYALWSGYTKTPAIEDDPYNYKVPYYGRFSRNDINNYGTYENTFTVHGTVAFADISQTDSGFYFNNSWMEGSVELEKTFTVDLALRPLGAQNAVLFGYGDADGFKLKLTSDYNVVFESKGVDILTMPVKSTARSLVRLSKSDTHIYLSVDDPYDVVNQTTANTVSIESAETYTGPAFGLGADSSGGNKFLGIMNLFGITNGVSKYIRAYELETAPSSTKITGHLTTYYTLEQVDQTYYFNATVDDQFYSNTRTFAMFKHRDNNPYFTNGPYLGEFIERSGMSLTIGAGDTEGYPLEYTIISGDFPNTLTLNQHNGDINGSAPTVNGSLTRYEFTVQVDDSNHVTTANYYFNVQEDFVPVWDNSPAFIGNVIGGEFFDAIVHATDQNSSQILSYTLANADSMPVGLDISPTSGYISGTAAMVDQDTTYYPEIRVSDGYNSNTRIFQINVFKNEPPYFEPDTGTTLTNGWEQMVALDSDAGDDPIVITIIEPNNNLMKVEYDAPDYVIISNTTNANGVSTITISNVTYPAVNADTIDTMTISADDGVLTTVATYKFGIKFNSPPIWLTPENLGIVQESSWLMATVEAESNGLPVYYSLDMANTTMTDVYVDVNTGNINWYAPPVFVDTQYYVGVIASTGIKFSYQRFVVTVKRNRPPVWVTGGDLGEIFELKTFNQVLSAYDPDDYFLTYQLSNSSTLPLWLTMTDSTGTYPTVNTVTLMGNTPIVAQNTVVSFTVGAMDDFHLVERDFSFTIVYRAEPQWITPSNLGSLVAGQDLHYQLSANSSVSSLTYSAVSMPTTMVLNSNGMITGEISATHLDGEVLTFSVTATDTDGRSNTQTFSTTVIGADMLTATSPTGVSTTYKAGSSIVMNAAGTWKIRTLENVSFSSKLWGGGGGGYNGGVGGYAGGTINNIPADTTLTIWVGGPGVSGNNIGRAGGFGGGGYAGVSYNSGYFASSGGGLSGIFMSNSTPVIGNAIIIAAGGGGQVQDGVGGGNGGGTSGAAGGFRSGQQLQGGGGTQTAGGTVSTAAGATAVAGSALQGGGGAVNIGSRSGGGGGGGYYGGGGGGSGSGAQVSGGSGGGGGSSYIASPYISDGETVMGTGYVPPKTDDVDYINFAGGSGSYLGYTTSANGMVSANGLVVIKV